jgi:hypothetical protein
MAVSPDRASFFIRLFLWHFFIFKALELRIKSKHAQSWPAQAKSLAALYTREVHLQPSACVFMFFLQREANLPQLME